MNTGSNRGAAATPSSERAARPLASGEPAARGQEVHCRRLLGLSVLRRPAGGSGGAELGGLARCLLKEQEAPSRLRWARCPNGKKEQSNCEAEVPPRWPGRSVSQRLFEERRVRLSRYRCARCGCGVEVRASVHLAANPSIERTCPGKPGPAAHVELQGLPHSSSKG